MDRPVEARLYIIMPEIPGEERTAYKKVYQMTAAEFLKFATVVDELNLYSPDPKEEEYTTFTDQDEVEA